MSTADRNRKINLIASLIIFSTLTIIDYFYKKTFEKTSIKITLSINQSHFLIKTYFLIFSYPIYYLIDAIIFLSLFFRRNKKEAFTGLCLIGFDRFINTLLKISFYDSRPCFEDIEISKIGCYCSFGKPSGHCSLGTVFYFFIFYSCIYKKNIGYSLKQMFFGVYLFVIFNIGVSRIFFGAHFFNQVFLGYSLGYVLISVYLIVDKSDFINIILNTKNEDFLNENDFHVLKLKNKFFLKEENEKSDCKIILNAIDKKKFRKKYCEIIIFIIFLINFIDLALGIYTILMIENNPYHPYSRKFCDSICFDNGQFLVFDALKSTYFYDVLIFIFHFLKSRDDKAFYYNHSYYKDITKSIKFVSKRIFILLLICLPLIISIILRNIFSNFVFVTFLINISNIVFTLFFTILYPWILKKTTLYVKGDFFIGL